MRCEAWDQLITWSTWFRSTGLPVYLVNLVNLVYLVHLVNWVYLLLCLWQWKARFGFWILHCVCHCYDFKAFLRQYFTKYPGISKIHHFSFSAVSTGEVKVQEGVDSGTRMIRLLRKAMENVNVNGVLRSKRSMMNSAIQQQSVLIAQSRLDVQHNPIVATHCREDHSQTFEWYIISQSHASA